MMKFDKKFGLSEIIAAVALILSGVAIWQSILARNDAKIINKQGFRPSISLKAQLHKISDKIPAHISLKNKGPVDAIQVEVQFHYHKYSPEKQEVKSYDPPRK